LIRSYLVTSINVEIDRLREEDEQRQDTEAERAIIWEKIHRRPPLADLSKKTTGLRLVFVVVIELISFVF